MRYFPTTLVEGPPGLYPDNPCHCAMLFGSDRDIDIKTLRNGTKFSGKNSCAVGIRRLKIHPDIDEHGTRRAEAPLRSRCNIYKSRPFANFDGSRVQNPPEHRDIGALEIPERASRFTDIAYLRKSVGWWFKSTRAHQFFRLRDLLPSV